MGEADFKFLPFATAHRLRIPGSSSGESPSKDSVLNLQAPCVLYMGQAFRYSPENAFYIFNQQIYFII